MIDRRAIPSIHRPFGRLVAGLVALALVAAACSADEPEPESGAAAFVEDGAVLIVANSPGTVSTNGPQRMLLALLGEGPNEFFGDENSPASFEFEGPGGTTETATADYLSATGVALGLYVADVEFAETGRWQVKVVGTDLPTGTMEFDVSDDSIVPERGDQAPLSDTPVANSLDEASAISTDLDPDLDFYDLSIAQAVSNGRPTVIAFATPAFCQTALCGPTLDVVKEATAGQDDIDVVHVEPFDIPSARNGTLQPIQAMFDWQLVTEPWVFVVNADGTVAKGFEGIVGADELSAAIDALG